MMDTNEKTFKYESAPLSPERRKEIIERTFLYCSCGSSGIVIGKAYLECSSCGHEHKGCVIADPVRIAAYVDSKVREERERNQSITDELLRRAMERYPDGKIPIAYLVGALLPQSPTSQQIEAAADLIRKDPKDETK